MITPVALRITDDVVAARALELRRTGFRVELATPGDHPAIFQFLLNVFRQPTAGEFQSQLDAPQYEPTDRLLIKRDTQVVAHVRTAMRDMSFGPISLPVGCLSDVGTLPQYQNRGCATILLEEAERKLRRGGAVLGFLRTEIPQFYRRRGWAVCGRQSFSTGAARDILSQLDKLDRGPPTPAAPSQPPLRIRYWRQVEQAALIRLYQEHAQNAFGAWLRNDIYWRWLISRRAYDRLYVAIEGDTKLPLDDAQLPIVGYAFAREGRIAEIMTSSRRPDAAASLLARACGDAIEQDCSDLHLDAPPDHPLHHVIADAGGTHRQAEVANGQVFMMKTFDAMSLVKLLRPLLQDRVRRAGLPLPFELGLVVGNERNVLEVTARDVKLRPGRLKRSYLTCSEQLLTQLLLGHCDVREAIERRQVIASTRIVADLAESLFPQRPLWFPPLDDLTA